jgi:hypothetical protein
MNVDGEQGEAHPEVDEAESQPSTDSPFHAGSWGTNRTTRRRGLLANGRALVIAAVVLATIAVAGASYLINSRGDSPAAAKDQGEASGTEGTGETAAPEGWQRFESVGLAGVRRDEWAATALGANLIEESRDEVEKIYPGDMSVLDLGLTVLDGMEGLQITLGDGIGSLVGVNCFLTLPPLIWGEETLGPIRSEGFEAELLEQVFYLNEYRTLIRVSQGEFDVYMTIASLDNCVVLAELIAPRGVPVHLDDFRTMLSSLILDTTSYNRRAFGSGAIR